METIPVKITKSSLNGQAAKPADPAPPKNKPSANKAKRVFIWLLTILVLAETGALAFLCFKQPPSPYASLIAPDAVIAANFDKAAFSETIISLKNGQFSWGPFSSASNNLSWLLDQTGINLAEIGTFFDNQMALAVLPGLINNSPRWLFLATLKTDDAAFRQALGKTEKNLKQNYNLIPQNYRQISLTEIKSLNQNAPSVFYALVNKTFILGNSEAAIKAVIDKKLP